MEKATYSIENALEIWEANSITSGISKKHREIGEILGDLLAFRETLPHVAERRYRILEPGLLREAEHVLVAKTLLLFGKDGSQLGQKELAALSQKEYDLFSTYRDGKEKEVQWHLKVRMTHVAFIDIASSLQTISSTGGHHGEPGNGYCQVNHAFN